MGIDREKVIKGLERLSYNAGCISIYDSDCKSCPYKHVNGCVGQIIKDALELLKAQEPHIVTIADYENNPNVDKDGNLAVWRESRHLNGIAYHNDGWVILNRNRVEGWFNSEMIRFWTHRPIDEQREATPWN